MRTRSERDPDFYATGGWGYTDRDRDRERLTGTYLRHVDLPFGTASALDAGCGDGYWSAMLMDDGYDVTGIDHSEDAIRTAREKNPGPTYQLADARKRIQRLGMFDLVFCRAISPIGQPRTDLARRVIGNLAATLNPGGWFVLIRATDGTGQDGTGQFGGRATNPLVSDLVALLEPHLSIVAVEVSGGEAVITARRAA